MFDFTSVVGCQRPILHHPCHTYTCWCRWRAGWPRALNPDSCTNDSMYGRVWLCMMAWLATGGNSRRHERKVLPGEQTHEKPKCWFKGIIIVHYLISWLDSEAKSKVTRFSVQIKVSKFITPEQDVRVDLPRKLITSFPSIIFFFHKFKQRKYELPGNEIKRLSYSKYPVYLHGIKIADKNKFILLCKRQKVRGRTRTRLKLNV